MELLTRFSLELARRRDDRFNPPYATLNIGAIEAGEDHRPNIIPDVCELYLDVRPLPGQSMTEILTALRELLGTIDEYEQFETHPAQELNFVKPPTPPMETRSDAPIVTVAEAVCGRKAGGVSFSTEATIYNAAGIESIVLGPGNIAQAHTLHEFLSLRWLDSHELLTEIARRFGLERNELIKVAAGRRLGDRRPICPVPEKITVRLPHLIQPEATPKTIAAILESAARYHRRHIVVKADWHDGQSFQQLLADLELLKSLGFSITLVLGLTEALKADQAPIRFVNGFPVADERLEPFFLRLEDKISRHFERSDARYALYPKALLKIDPSVSDRRTVTESHGLYVDERFLTGMISNDHLPVIVPIAEQNGRLRLLSAEQIAGATAMTVQAVKLILLSPLRGIFRGRELISYCTPAELEAYLPQLRGRMHLEATVALAAARAGVPRIHLISQEHRALLVELFTDSGHGTMVTTDGP